ncbi:MAG: glucosaminidase domain-containing protein [Bacilli bacterium]|nr:glucosaminidase domain-containing protein [Bacilli bacterium]
MKKLNYIAAGLSTIGFSMILVAMLMLNGVDISNIKVSDSILAFNEVKEEESTNSNEETIINDIKVKQLSSVVTEKRKIAKAESLRVEVYDGLTLEELAARLNRNLGSATLAGKGELVASYALQKGVDPYVATAIMILETGYGTSKMVRTCNNVAGQKGSPNCMGAYKGYPTIDDGIRGAIDNLYNNYYSKGLTTVETIGPKYAESSTWVSKINSFINKIRNN